MPESPSVVIVTGRPCAGKTTFAEALASHLGIQLIECSDVLRALRAETGSSATLAEFADSLPSDAIGRRLRATLTADAVVSGPRSFDDFAYIIEQIGARVVCVCADEETRIARAELRARDEFATPAAFRENEARQATLGFLDQIETYADVIIENRNQTDVTVLVAGAAAAFQAVPRARCRSLQRFATFTPATIA